MFTKTSHAGKACSDKRVPTKTRRLGCVRLFHDLRRLSLPNADNGVQHRLLPGSLYSISLIFSPCKLTPPHPHPQPLQRLSKGNRNSQMANEPLGQICSAIWLPLPPPSPRPARLAQTQQLVGSASFQTAPPSMAGAPPEIPFISQLDYPLKKKKCVFLGRGADGRAAKSGHVARTNKLPTPMLPGRLPTEAGLLGEALPQGAYNQKQHDTGPRAHKVTECIVPIGVQFGQKSTPACPQWHKSLKPLPSPQDR